MVRLLPALFIFAALLGCEAEDPQDVSADDPEGFVFDADFTEWAQPDPVDAAPVLTARDAGLEADAATQVVRDAGAVRPDDPACGDGVCDASESCQICEADCGACAGCGDGFCSGLETCDQCPDDCGQCVSLCGDDVCDPGETCGGCAEDCGACPARCGDGQCNGDEDCGACAEDCGACAPRCGDGQCNGDEDCGVCAEDCGACAPRCGDGQCNGDEDCGACAEDCGACAPRCGDGQCNGAETCERCDQDCGACGWPEDWARDEEQILVLVNELRATGANCGGAQMGVVPPLRMNAELRQAARLHSQDMATQNYFDHTGLNGSTFGQRAAAAGYRGFAGGENIAAGSATAQATFNQWLNSPGHCQNMMRARFGEIGVGHAYQQGSQWGHYWTQVFGQ